MVGPFFKATAHCKIPGCHSFQMEIADDPHTSGNKELEMLVHRTGKPRHGEVFAHRWLTCKTRARRAKMVNIHGVYAARAQLLEDAPEEQLIDGNITEAPPSHILCQAAFEGRQKERHARDWCEDIAITMKLSKDEDTTSTKLPGGIHLVGRDPLVVHLYREHYLRKLQPEKSVLHIDATGTLSRQVGEKRPLLYVVLAVDEDGNSYPLAQMLAESHSAPTIAHIMSHLARDFKRVTGKPLVPARIVSDYSWAIIHVATEGILKTNLLSYLEKCWECAQEGGSPPDTLLSLCCAHVSKQLSMELRKLQLPQEVRQGYMWLFARAQQATTMTELERIFCLICRLALSPREQQVEIPSVPIPQGEEEEKGNEIGEHRRRFKPRTTYREKTTFGRHFDSIC